MASAPVFQHASATPLERYVAELNGHPMRVLRGQECVRLDAAQRAAVRSRAARSVDQSRALVKQSREVTERLREAINRQRGISPREHKVLEAAEVYRTVLHTKSSSEIVYAQRALLMAAVEQP